MALTHHERGFKPPVTDPPAGMYLTKGIDAIATITELRSNTSELLEYAKEIERGILIQKNNQPYAVLISWELYDKLLAAEGNQEEEKPWRKKEKK